MRISILSVFLLLMILSGCIEKRNQPQVTRESAVSGELLGMVEEAQQMRYRDTLDAAIIAETDLVQRKRVFELLAAGEITEPKNLFYTAVILQNSNPETCAECFLLAYDLSTEAINRGFDEARSLAATSLDRYLVLTGHPQKFGTQIGIDPDGNSYLFTIDTLTTDSMRRLWDVPPLDSLKTRVEILNQEITR